MRTALAFAFMMLLAFGCTINPQESVANGSGQALGDGAAGGVSGNASAGGAGANSSGNAATPDSGQADAKLFTIEEVAKHGVKGDCWMAIGGKVLDLSDYSSHPGGDTFVPYCGKDGTEGFATMGGRGRDHSARAYAEIDDYVIGALKQ